MTPIFHHYDFSPFSEKIRIAFGMKGLVWSSVEILFWPVVRYTSGLNAERMSPDLHADRAAMRGKGAVAPPPAKLKAVAERNAGLVRAGVTRVAQMLSHGRPYLLGVRPGVADLAVYHSLWFRSALTIDCAPAALEALEVARASKPPPPRPSSPAPFDPPLGTRVAVRPEGYNVEDTAGELVLLDIDELAVRRDDLVVHFPRVGYSMRPDRGS